jgi:hypothetical protein
MSDEIDRGIFEAHDRGRWLTRQLDAFVRLTGDQLPRVRPECR